MPKLPLISGAQALRVFGQLGFTPVRRRGSHVVLRRDDKGCVIPMHRELAQGTLRSALKQAGIDADDFVHAWRNL